MTQPPNPSPGPQRPPPGLPTPPWMQQPASTPPDAPGEPATAEAIDDEIGQWLSDNVGDELHDQPPEPTAMTPQQPQAARQPIPTPQPVHYRPMFGALGKAMTESSVTFVSQAAADAGIGDSLGLQKPVLPVSGCRLVKKSDMVLNGATPDMEVDPETYEVRADGDLLTCEPATELSMAQRYFLF